LTVVEGACIELVLHGPFMMSIENIKLLISAGIPDVAGLRGQTKDSLVDRGIPVEIATKVERSMRAMNLLIGERNSSVDVGFSDNVHHALVADWLRDRCMVALEKK